MQFIIGAVADHGYHGNAFEIEAQHYGSFPQRKRLYFVLCKGNGTMTIELIKGIQKLTVDGETLTARWSSKALPSAPQQASLVRNTDTGEVQEWHPLME